MLILSKLIFDIVYFSTVIWPEKNEMGRACGTYEGRERGAQGSGGET